MRIDVRVSCSSRVARDARTWSARSRRSIARRLYRREALAKLVVVVLALAKALAYAASAVTERSPALGVEHEQQHDGNNDA